MLASRRRTWSLSFLERSISPRRRSGKSLMVSGSPGSPAASLTLDLFLVGLGERHLALLDRAVQQQPRGKLHQPRGQPHAFGGIGERRAALELLGFLPAGAIEIGRGFLDQRHAVAKQTGKRLGAGELLAEVDRRRFVGGTLFHTVRLTPTARDMTRVGRTCPAVQPQCLRNGNRPDRRCPETEQKRAAVAGGSKVITGRRQTEWTGATQCP